MNSTIQLGINIDHVATLRQVRGTPYPDPVRAALEAEESMIGLRTRIVCSAGKCSAAA